MAALLKVSHLLVLVKGWYSKVDKLENLVLHSGVVETRQIDTSSPSLSYLTCADDVICLSKDFPLLTDVLRSLL